MIKKWTITIGACLISLLGANQVNNQFEVEINLDGSNQLVFETRLDCVAAKDELIVLFEQQNLTPKQAYALKAFQDENCGVFLESSVPLGAGELIVGPEYIYYSVEQKNARKVEIVAKGTLSWLEKREAIGILQAEGNLLSFQGDFNNNSICDALSN